QVSKSHAEQSTQPEPQDHLHRRNCCVLQKLAPAKLTKRFVKELANGWNHITGDLEKFGSDIPRQDEQNEDGRWQCQIFSHALIVSSFHETQLFGKKPVGVQIFNGYGFL